MATRETNTLRTLHELADLYGVQRSYENMLDGRRRCSSPEVLINVLRALGAPLQGERDAPSALRECRQRLYRRGPEPVVVCYDGVGAKLRVRLAARPTSRLARCALKLEGGGERSWLVRPEDPATVSQSRKLKVEGQPYWVIDMRLPRKLPWGYHSITIESGGVDFHALVIAAPRKAFVDSGEGSRKRWGVFIPVYALESQTNWGVGDLGDLAALMRWVQSQGGSLIGTLPLLSSFLSEPFDPSPYSPVSRLFWNELFLDMRQIPEMGQCASAQAIVASPDFRAEVEALRSQSLVDYRRAMSLKRRVLTLLARSIYHESSPRRTEFLRYVECHLDLQDYARFRATCDHRRSSWWTWPQPLRDGKLRATDYGLEAMRYHLYVQWVAEQQIRGLAKGEQIDGQGLYLDLPLGVNPDGYDVWRERSTFALQASAGAPPDDFFTKGQDWGFPPMHPESVRGEGYRYFRKALQHHLSHCHVLRIDHVMGLHRLFWIPKGFPPSEGAYVRYHAEEMYAILALESVGNRALIVGEDLGTVPGYVRPALARHRVQRMYVLQFEASPKKRRPISLPSVDSLAALNTHDMPPFAAFWEGLDIQDRGALGLLDKEAAKAEWDRRRKLRSALADFLCDGAAARRSPSVLEVLKASLAYLGSSRGRMVMVNLEDLWLEKQPQNVPGTVEERPNWRRKARCNLDEIARRTEVKEMLKTLDNARRGKAIK